MFLQKVRCLHVSAVRLGAAFAPFTLAGVHNSRPTKKRAHVHVDRRLRCARAHVTSCSALEERTRLPTHARLSPHTRPHSFRPACTPESLRMPSACAQALGTPARTSSGVLGGGGGTSHVDCLTR